VVLEREREDFRERGGIFVCEENGGCKWCLLTIIRWLAALSIFCFCGLYAFIVCFYFIYLCE